MLLKKDPETMNRLQMHAMSGGELGNNFESNFNFNSLNVYCSYSLSGVANTSTNFLSPSPSAETDVQSSSAATNNAAATKINDGLLWSAHVLRRRAMFIGGTSRKSAGWTGQLWSEWDCSYFLSNSIKTKSSESRTNFKVYLRRCYVSSSVLGSPVINS